MTRNILGPSLGMAGALCMAVTTPAVSAPAAAANQNKSEAYINGVTAAGLTCDLTSMTLRNSNAQRDIVEFGCANGDGRIASFTNATPTTVTLYNCVTSRIIQYACSGTKESTAYPLVSADIRKVDNSNRCTVDSARLMGVAANNKSAYLEVGCVESSMNGQVVQYDTASLKPMAVVDCGGISTTMAGGCKLTGAVVNAPSGLIDESMSTASGGQVQGFDRSAIMRTGP